MNFSTTNWLLPWVPTIHLCKDWITCRCSYWPSTPPRRSSGRRAEMRPSNASGKLAGQVCRLNWSWVQFFHLLVSRKTLQSFIVTTASCDKQKLQETLRTSLKNKRVYLWRIHVDIWQNQYNIVKLKNKIKKKNKINGLDCQCASFTKITYVWPSPLPLWSSLSELSEVLSSGVQSSLCPQENLTHNSHVAHLSQQIRCLKQV